MQTDTESPGLYHNINDPGHTHTIPSLTHDTVNHEPPYVVLAFIERIK